jgi:hypothetical protein
MVAELPTQESLQQRFIFVTGASRSGTTMMSLILGNAEECAALKELHFFDELAPSPGAAATLSRNQAVAVVARTLARHARDYWAGDPQPEERSVAQRIVDETGTDRLSPEVLFAITMRHIAREEVAERICEQTPRNIYFARGLLRVFPNAIVVHMMRDPRAVLASQKNRFRIRELGGKNVPVHEVMRLWASYHPVTMVRLWVSATREALSMDGHDRFHVVRYEDLIDEPEVTVSSLCERLGIDFRPEMLAIPHWGSSTVSHTATGGVSKKSLEKWRSVLTSTEVAYCDARTKSERARFGYPEAERAKPSISGVMRFLLRLPIHVLGTILADPRRVIVQLRAMLVRGG